MLAAILVCLGVPALAAAKVTVPPGATEGDQYFEEVPDGGGSGSVNHGGTSGGGGGAGGSGSAAAPSVAATQALDKLGPDGKAAAGVANANRPPELKATNIPSEPPSSSTEGDDGMGFWFPLLIVLTGVAAIAYGLRRRLLPAP